jgi:hypothetical protein
VIGADIAKFIAAPGWQASLAAGAGNAIRRDRGPALSAEHAWAVAVWRRVWTLNRIFLCGSSMMG